jgi:hypothetical protein
MTGFAARKASPAVLSNDAKKIEIPNDAIMLRASMMSVNIHSDNFDSIDLLRELEDARSNLSKKSNNKVQKTWWLNNDNGTCTPLILTWQARTMVDDSFTVVKYKRSRKKSSKNKTHVSVSRPLTRSQVLLPIMS